VELETRGVRRAEKEKRVLLAFLADPDGWHYVYDLKKASGLRWASVYRALAKLEDVYWVVASWEQGVEPPRQRRMYRLTSFGVPAARMTAARDTG
jgi:DNA-binding PadR family transcriptional regulator